MATSAAAGIRPGDYVLYYGAHLRLHGWTMRVTAVHGTVVRLREEVWGIGLSAHLSQVVREPIA